MCVGVCECVSYVGAVLFQSLLLADDVLQVLDGLGHTRVNVDQVVRADGCLMPQHPLVERKAQW